MRIHFSGHIKTKRLAARFDLWGYKAQNGISRIMRRSNVGVSCLMRSLALLSWHVEVMQSAVKSTLRVPLVRGHSCQNMSSYVWGCMEFSSYKGYLYWLQGNHKLMRSLGLQASDITGSSYFELSSRCRKNLSNCCTSEPFKGEDYHMAQLENLKYVEKILLV